MPNKRNGASKAFATPAALAAALGASVATLMQIVDHPAAYYGLRTLTKKSGGTRTIRPPRKPLKQLQRRLLHLFYEFWQLQACVVGGVPGRSHIDHAKMHVNRKWVATLDVQSFFPTTSRSMVRAALATRLPSEEVAELVASLCSVDDELPQGSPTSTFLANAAFARADNAFLRHCRPHGLTYSRYVDDIAVSGDADLGEHVGAFADIVRAAGYSVNAGKTRVMPQGRRQLVTNLVVNAQVRPTLAYIRRLKRSIWEAIELGPELAADACGVGVADLKRRLTGQVAFVIAVYPREGRGLRRLLYRLWSGTGGNKGEV